MGLLQHRRNYQKYQVEDKSPARHLRYQTRAKSEAASVHRNWLAREDTLEPEHLLLILAQEGDFVHRKLGEYLLLREFNRRWPKPGTSGRCTTTNSSEVNCQIYQSLKMNFSNILQQNLGKSR